MIAMGVYLLICRNLAVRVEQPALARNFRRIFRYFLPGAGWFMIGLVCMQMGWPVPLAAAAAAAQPAPDLVSSLRRLALGCGPSLLSLCFLVAIVWQIIASFQLAAALRRAPRQLSDDAAAGDPPGSGGSAGALQ